MKDRFTEAQMIRIIKEQESGMSVVAICRKYGIGDSTFYRWKAKYGGMEVKELQKLKHLEAENRKLNASLLTYLWIRLCSKMYCQKSSKTSLTT